MKNSLNITLPKGFVLIVALMISISPLAIDTYLAAFTQMSDYYNTSINMIEITLSVYLFGFAFGQLFGGPLADKYGRKPFMSLGIIVFSITSVSIVFATTIESFWILRFIQAFGSGFIGVNALAMIRDLFKGKEASKVMTFVSMVMMIAPILAPVIGTTILNFATWHYIFVFLGIYGLSSVIFLIKLPETSNKNRDHKFIKNYKTILTDKLTLILMIGSSLSISGLFIYITKSSFMYMEIFKFTPNEFTMIYVVNALMLVVFGVVNIKLLKKYTTLQLLLTGILIQVIVAFLLVAFYSIHNVYSITFLIMAYIGSLGFIFPNSFSLIMEKYHSLSGTANALSGVFNSLFASIVSFSSSLFHDGTLSPIFMMMLIVGSTSLTIIFLNKKEITTLAH